MAFLDSIVAGKRIIFIGEGNHGDGTTISAKSRLMKYLMRNHDFSVLVFEVPFYETYRTNSFMNLKDLDTKYVLYEIFRSSIFITQQYTLNLIPIIVENQQRVIIAGVDLANNSRFRFLLENDLISSGVEKKLARKYC